MILIAPINVYRTLCSVINHLKNNIVIFVLFQEKCHQYWPSERSARYQYFVVDPMAEYDMPSYMLREFKVTDARVNVLFK